MDRITLNEEAQKEILAKVNKEDISEAVEYHDGMTEELLESLLDETE